jgi:hypothetical protein
MSNDKAATCIIASTLSMPDRYAASRQYKLVLNDWEETSTGTLQRVAYAFVQAF